MALLLLLLFVVVPIAELAVIVTVARLHRRVQHDRSADPRVLPRRAGWPSARASAVYRRVQAALEQGRAAQPRGRRRLPDPLGRRPDARAGLHHRHAGPAAAVPAHSGGGPRRAVSRRASGAGSAVGRSGFGGAATPRRARPARRVGRRQLGGRGPRPRHRASSGGQAVTDKAVDEAGPGAEAPRLRGGRRAVAHGAAHRVPTTPSSMTGPGTNTYLVGIDEIVVIDPGPDDEAHLDAIAGLRRRPHPLDPADPHALRPLPRRRRPQGAHRGRGPRVRQRQRRARQRPDAIDGTLARQRRDRGDRVPPHRPAHAGPRRPTTSASSSTRSACCSRATTSCRARPW